MQTPTLSKEHGLDVVQPTTPRPSRLLFWLSIVLAVALVALATWMVVDRYVFAPPPAEDIVTVVDDTIAAWDVGDPAAITALYAEDAVFYDGPLGTDPIEGSEAIADYVVGIGAMGFRIERAGPTQVVDDTAITVTNYGGEDETSVAMSMIEVNSDGLIVRHWYEIVTEVEAII